MHNRDTNGPTRAPWAAAAAALLTSSALAACSTTAETPAPSTDSTAGSDKTSTKLVATTQVWADIAAAVTGSDVDAIITGQNIDPHHFEPAAKDLAKVAKAEYVVANGGAYDASLYTVAEQDRIIHAIPLLSKEEAAEHTHDHSDHDHADHTGHDHGDHDHDHADRDRDHDHNHTLTFDYDDIEHAWFVPAKVAEVARVVGEKVGGDASGVEKQMLDLDERLKTLPHSHIAMTEPIAAGLVYGTELHDVTPEGYQRASLNHAEPSAQDVAAFVQLIESGELDFLVVNPQSTNSATQRLIDAARDRNVPTVEIAETPPAGVNFLDYLDSVVTQIENLTAH